MDLQRYVRENSSEDENGCWLWTGRIQAGTRGYGVYSQTIARQHGLSALAHRLAYSAFVGPIPDGLHLDHLCRVRHCVNPDHLEPVTLRENVLRGVSFAAVNVLKTHCPQGHPYDEANTYVYQARGHRRRCCRACNRQAKREAS